MNHELKSTINSIFIHILIDIFMSHTLPLKMGNNIKPRFVKTKKKRNTRLFYNHKRFNQKTKKEKYQNIMKIKDINK
jgi:hypothetical protein